ncbi:Rieske 2Fe-2S domain-containing protein [Crocinitomicaceae bacterium]|nr:Rieske 2Fe-2S domain-containing protein [Crocinitomicaceae bacterium]MDB3907748.1 Rieske 2Fe-2S domain-containing protein [Crocinitomicaceae bacterium]
MNCSVCLFNVLKFKIKWILAFSSTQELEEHFALKNTAVIPSSYGKILWVKFEDGYHAFKNKCPHQNKPMDHCWIDGGDLVCPFHRFHFSVENGRGMATSMYKYEVKIEEDKVWLGKEVLGLSFQLKLKRVNKVRDHR